MAERALPPTTPGPASPRITLGCWETAFEEALCQFVLRGPGETAHPDRCGPPLVAPTAIAVPDADAATTGHNEGLWRSPGVRKSWHPPPTFQTHNPRPSVPREPSDPLSAHCTIAARESANPGISQARFLRAVLATPCRRAVPADLSASSPLNRLNL